MEANNTNKETGKPQVPEQEHNEKETLEGLRKAARAGDFDAQCELVDFLSHDERNKEEAFFWKMHVVETELSSSCEDMRIREANRIDKDCEIMGYPYDNGEGKWYITREAFELYKKFAEQGDAVAQHNLGYFYYDGECVRKNRATAIKWFTRAAEQDNEGAQFKLAGIYCKSQNYAEAFKWYRKSAEQGCVQSQFMVGEFYSKGMGVAQDDKEAVRWYKKAVGHMKRKKSWELRWLPEAVWRACKRLGQCYHEGRGVKQNDKTAAVWYERLWRIMTGVIDTEDVLFEIAEGYYYGKGINQDYNEAIKWYKRSAEQLTHGMAAQRRLAEIYEEGTIVPQDYKKAFKWYMETAKNGDVDAMYKIGVYYLEGKGVKQNKEKAVACFEEAAIYGSKEAEKRLAKS